MQVQVVLVVVRGEKKETTKRKQEQQPMKAGAESTHHARTYKQAKGKENVLEALDLPLSLLYMRAAFACCLG